MAPSLSDSPLLFDLPVRPDFNLERGARRDGLWPVAGVDEAGRGPLAGPVVAAAVILDANHIPEGLDDSKRLSPETREVIFNEIMSQALAVSIASICAGSIDCSDIRLASLEAMRRAVATLSIQPLLVLADGRDIPPGLACQCKALVKGDQRSQSVAAASIVAKVIRDRTMARAGAWDERFGFDSHAGYATARHREAIIRHGPVMRMHRMTFAPCKQ